MELEFLKERLVPIIIIACLVVGYVIKTTPVLQEAREYIPFIVCILGAILGATVNGMNVEAIVIGAASGLASTGLYQVFAKVLNLKKGE